MINFHVSTKRTEHFVVAGDSTTQVQLIESGPECINWLIVREGSVEHRIPLSLSALGTLCMAVSKHPYFSRVVNEKRGEQ